MSSVYQIKLADLNPQLLQELQTQYGNTEVELHVTAPARWSPEQENWFWAAIERLDWNQEGNDAQVIQPLVQYLASQPLHLIFRFADILSEKLYRLDALVFAENMGEYSFRDGYYFSVDDFLYARCCVVANGRQAYQNVLEDPSEMPAEQTFEPLLRVASDAYQIKTGQRMHYQPAYATETFSNKEGWKETEEG
jgi:hypothetical protein